MQNFLYVNSALLNNSVVECGKYTIDINTKWTEHMRKFMKLLWCLESFPLLLMSNLVYVYRINDI